MITGVGSGAGTGGTVAAEQSVLYNRLMSEEKEFYKNKTLEEMTPEEWETVKWYDYCLISNGAEWIANSLREEEKPEVAELFDRIEKNVKRPKIIS